MDSGQWPPKRRRAQRMNRAGHAQRHRRNRVTFGGCEWKSARAIMAPGQFSANRRRAGDSLVARVLILFGIRLSHKFRNHVNEWAASLMVPTKRPGFPSKPARQRLVIAVDGYPARGRSFAQYSQSHHYRYHRQIRQVTLGGTGTEAAPV